MMKKIIIPTTLEDEAENLIKKTVIRQPQPYSDQTSNLYSNEMVYQTKMPSNVDIFENISTSLSSFDDTIKMNTVALLKSINHALLSINDLNEISNYFSKLHITKQEDSSALIEWNFQDFRIGFTVERDINESSYFIISEDKTKGSFCAETHKIGADYNSVITNIIDYVIRNT